MDESIDKTGANACDTDPICIQHMKTEDSLPAFDYDDLDKVSEYVSSLIGTAETNNVKTESNNERESRSGTRSEEQHIKPDICSADDDLNANVSDDFFDDLLNDPEAEQIAETDLETKYSEQLKQPPEELNEFHNDDDDRAGSREPHTTPGKKRKNSSKHSTPDNDDPEPKRKRSHSPVSTPKISVVSAHSLAPKQNSLKGNSTQDGVDMANAALQILELMEYQGYTEEPFDEFNYTPIVWRAPEDKPAVNQSSELLYSFQSNVPFDEQHYDASISFRIPQRTEDIARALGLDVQRIHDKLLKLNAWPPLQKKIEKALKSVNNSHEVVAFKSHSTEVDHSDVKTQNLEETKIWQGPLHAAYMPNGNTRPAQSSIGTQVNFTNSDGRSFAALQHLPMMHLMQSFNEHQLLALNDFAELISTADRVSNAMDLYCVRQRLMDIYNASQMPSIVKSNIP